MVMLFLKKEKIKNKNYNHAKSQLQGPESQFMCQCMILIK